MHINTIKRADGHEPSECTLIFTMLFGEGSLDEFCWKISIRTKQFFASPLLHFVHQFAMGFESFESFYIFQTHKMV